MRQTDDETDDGCVDLAGEAAHERLVDLDHVNGQVTKDRERRVTGPEVVERNFRTELPQRAQHTARPVDVAHHRRLGELEAQAVRIRTVMLAEPSHATRERVGEIVG